MPSQDNQYLISVPEERYNSPDEYEIFGIILVDLI